jgi:hypothetical protein
MITLCRQGSCENLLLVMQVKHFKSWTWGRRFGKYSRNYPETSRIGEGNWKGSLTYVIGSGGSVSNLPSID